MSIEPALDRQALLAWLSAAYGRSFGALEFISSGTAPAYRAEGSGKCFFVKIIPHTDYGAALLERITAEVPLLSTLRKRSILPNVPVVVMSTAGLPLGRFNEYAVLVHEWIDAANLGATWTSALPELAGLLGRLHAGSNLVTETGLRLPVETEDFALPFEQAWRDNLHRLRHPQRNERSGVRALRQLLLPLESELAGMLHEVRLLAQSARARDLPLVVCHTDAHGGNVMRDASGTLWIIDWETARLAPREHDLWMLHSRLPEVLGAYEAELGQRVSLDLDALRFYFYRRVLEDLAVDVNMILREHTRDEEDAATLGIIERFVLPAASQVENDFERVRQALNQAGGRFT